MNHQNGRAAPVATGTALKKGAVVGADNKKENRPLAPAPQGFLLAVYDGHIRIGSIAETAGGWLALDMAGRRLGCYQRHIDAMRALPPELRGR